MRETSAGSVGEAADGPRMGRLAPASAAPMRGRRRGRLLRTTAQILVVVSLAAAAAVGAMLLLTPSAAKAVAIVRSLAAEHGSPYPEPQPPQRFVKALVATEDHRFYSALDPGVDPLAVIRVTYDVIMGRRGDLGGSTIEQQLAKMLYTPGRRGLAVKFEQVAIGVKLRFAYSKAQILAMYAEVVYFGDGYYGLERASCGYFGKPAADLTWSQAAMLAGVVNGPSLFDPRLHPTDARRRQTHVFGRLVTVGDLSEDQAAAARAEPLGLVSAHCGGSSGAAGRRSWKPPSPPRAAPS